MASMVVPNRFCVHGRTHLTVVEDHQQIFRCDACRTNIFGRRFTCTICGFNLHPFCKTCSPSLSSFLHPNHALTLAAAASPNSACAVCCEPITGIHYTCAAESSAEPHPPLLGFSRRCHYDVHPLCSRLPAEILHALDRYHQLTLQYRPLQDRRRCNVCRGECSGWAYRCQHCSIDVHYRCLLIPAQPVLRPPPPPPATGNDQQRHYRPAWPLYFGYNNNGYGFPLPYHYNNGWPNGGLVATGEPTSWVWRIGGSMAANIISAFISDLIQNGDFLG